MRIGITGMVLRAVGYATLGLLLLPLLMVFMLALEPGSMMRFPPSGVTLDWFVAYLTSADWQHATLVSTRIGCATALLGTALGTMAAIGLHRSRLPGRSLAFALLLSPMLLPLIVAAIAIYGLYAVIGLVDTELGLVLAHSVIVIPYVVLTVKAALDGLPRSLEEAALTLGATPLTTVALVVLPQVWRAIATAAAFAFVMSFDEVVIAMFLSGVNTPTLPKKMLEGIFFDITPLLAAVAASLIVFSTLIVVASTLFQKKNAA